MRINRQITVIIILILSLFSEAAAQKYLNKGDQYYDRNMFEEAIPFYLQELEKGKKYTYKNSALERLASCYRLTGRFLEANDIYEELLSKGLRKNRSEKVLNYAKSLKSSALYEEAAEQFKKYIEMEPDDSLGTVYLESCYMAEKWLTEEREFSVLNHEILNTPQSDFAPVYYENGIVITSSREGSLSRFIDFSGTNQELATDLFYIPLTQQDGQSEVVNMKQLNSLSHDGTATFNADGSEVYFSRTVVGNKNRRRNTLLNTLQVYYSKKRPDGSWTEPVSAFSFNSENYSIGQPSLSTDGKTIYYISDMPGGSGKTDIYFSEKQHDGSWGPPVSAGGQINTSGYELFPYIHGNDTLYFSSDVHPGMGKMDIFYSIKKDGRWTSVINLKPPINSIANDFGIALAASGNRGFFSSDRFNGYGKEDIYTLYRNEPIQLEINGYEIRFPDHTLYSDLSYSLSIEKSDSIRQLQAAKGWYSFDIENDSLYNLRIRKGGFSYDVLKLRANYDQNEGLFMLSLQSRVTPMTVSGTLSFQKRIIERSMAVADEKPEENVEQIDTKPKIISIPSTKILLKEDTTILSSVMTDATGRYDFPDLLNGGKKYTLVTVSDDAKEDIIAKAKEPVDDVEPEKGEDSKVLNPVDNQLIAEKQNVIDRSKHINLSGKVVSSQDTTGIADVKIKVFGKDTLDGEGVTDTTGDFNIEVPLRERYDVEMNKKGYFHKQTQVRLSEAEESGVLGKVDLDPIEEDKTIELKNIFFDLDKSIIKPESYRALNNLVDFMNENPDVTIMLNAHTDTRGNYYYNINLSQKRALATKEYLQKRGIAGSRVFAQGFGESFPLIRNAVSESEHAQNRRVEFKVTDRFPIDQWNIQADEPLPLGFIISEDNIYSENRPFNRNTPLPRGRFYRIRLGEYKRRVDFYAFKGLFPVVEQVNSTNDKYLYYLGLFTSLEQAEAGLEIIRKKFAGAEIEAYEDNKKITIKEDVSINDRNTENIIQKQELFFSVQVGAYRQPLRPSGVKELQSLNPGYPFITLPDKSNIIYAVGHFYSYEDAVNAKKSLIGDTGYKEAFVIAILNDKKIPIKEAIRLSEEIRKEDNSRTK